MSRVGVGRVELEGARSRARVVLPHEHCSCQSNYWSCCGYDATNTFFFKHFNTLVQWLRKRYSHLLGPDYSETEVSIPKNEYRKLGNESNPR